MKHILNKILFLGLILLNNTAFADNIFQSKFAKCAITFPCGFETETTEEKGIKTISVTAIHENMIYMFIATVYDKDITEDENDLTEVITLINFATKTESKINNRKIMTFNVGGENGFYGFVKPKLNGEKHQGNYYVMIRGNVLYQFTALGIKKDYNKKLAYHFASSFKLISKKDKIQYE